MLLCLVSQDIVSPSTIAHRHSGHGAHFRVSYEASCPFAAVCGHFGACRPVLGSEDGREQVSHLTRHDSEPGEKVFGVEAPAPSTQDIEISEPRVECAEWYECCFMACQAAGSSPLPAVPGMEGARSREAVWRKKKGRFPPAASPHEILESIALDFGWSDLPPTMVIGLHREGKYPGEMSL